MARPQHDHLWALAHAERAALAKDLAGLGAAQWRHGTLCGAWDVEQVVAHLIAAASLSQWRWLRSMLGARFRPDVLICTSTGRARWGVAPSVRLRASAECAERSDSSMWCAVDVGTLIT